MTIEILVAASIIVVSVLAATAVAQKSIFISRQAFHTTQASFLLEEGAEAMRILRDNAWGNISSLSIGTSYYPKFSGGVWSLSTTSSDGVLSIFTRSLSVGNVNRDNTTKDIISSGGTFDPDTKLITVSVSWVEGGVTVTKILKFYLTNIFS